jgi:hypothetical protein
LVLGAAREAVVLERPRKKFRFRVSPEPVPLAKAISVMVTGPVNALLA